MKYEFKPPFRIDKDICWVYDRNENFCFQFQIDIPIGKAKHIEDIINGESKPKNKNIYEFHKEQGTITVNGKDLILIRGWGFLTSLGGLNMSDEEAFEVQNKLGNYLTEKLNATS